MFFEEICVDILVIFGYFFGIPLAWMLIKYKRNTKKLLEHPPVFLQKPSYNW